MTHGHRRALDGRSSSTYNSWRAMKLRCTNPQRRDFQWYGARGIQYDPRWDSFDAFLEDMGPRPEGTTLDRINVDGHYEKENCRWATILVQAHNRQEPWPEEIYGPPPDDWGHVAPKWPDRVVTVPDNSTATAAEMPF